MAHPEICTGDTKASMTLRRRLPDRHFNILRSLLKQIDLPEPFREATWRIFCSYTVDTNVDNLLDLESFLVVAAMIVSKTITDDCFHNAIFDTKRHITVYDCVNIFAFPRYTKEQLRQLVAIFGDIEICMLTYIDWNPLRFIYSLTEPQMNIDNPRSFTQSGATRSNEVRSEAEGLSNEARSEAPNGSTEPYACHGSPPIRSIPLYRITRDNYETTVPAKPRFVDSYISVADSSELSSEGESFRKTRGCCLS